MIISLQRMKVPEIAQFMEILSPTALTGEETQDIGPNWPKPKGSPFNPTHIMADLFAIADAYLDDEQIADLLKQWIVQENLSFISNLLERRHAPLSEISEALVKYLDITKSNPVLSFNERLGISVALIQRLLSDNLNYINIAKRYLNVEIFGNLINRMVGPSDGNGKLGGKSAGLILAYQIIQHKKKSNSLLNNVQTPKSWFITSDAIFEFIHFNALEEFVFTKYLNPEEIQLEYPFLEYIFKNAPFPHELLFGFKRILDDMDGKPLIIRSSSLLEDSFEASFSGKYKSLFISNIGSKEERLLALVNAVAEVYASTFGPDPMVYRKERGLLDFREEMGILIQEVVGSKIGKYYLPSYAGVAFSNNEFSWSPRIKREDGIIRLVAGLGTRAVDRTMNDYPILISPGKPTINVNTSIHDRIKYSQ
ncbi:MAG: PEP/pyruvate-binding domain-containing protein, partial [Ignavibacteria bacterium]|nr:PEP/pyruvate-binding domain-containing protein [Ignavibacteria bacterium]